MRSLNKSGSKNDEASVAIQVNNLNAKYLGTYLVTETYTSEGCGSGTDTYTLTVKEGISGITLLFDNLGGLFNNIKVNVTDNGITIVDQDEITDNNGDRWDMNDGASTTGTFDGTTLSFTYVVDDIYFAGECGVARMNVVAVKQ